MVEPFWFTLTTTTGATLTYKTFFNPIDPDRVNQGLVATNGSAKLQQWLPSNVSQTSLSYASPTVNNWGGYNTQSDSDPTTVSSLRGALDSSSALVTTDAYSLSPDGTAFEVRRSVKYVPASLGDASPGTGFDSTFGFTGPTTPGSDYQFFCPGQLYGSTRLDGGTLITPEATGNQKLWLSTLESTLPMMMMRHVPTGTTLIMAHMSEPSTALNAPPSSPSEFSSAAYTFGSFGGERGYGGTRINGFRYPASTTAPSDSTMTWRFHPSLTETVHEYTLRFMVYSTSSFEDAVDLAWRTGTDWFAPRIRPIDIPRLYDALGRCLGLYANKYSGDVAGTLPSSDPTSSGSACVPSAFVRSGAIESIPTTVTTSCPQVRAASYLYARALRRMEFTFAEKAEAVLSAWASRTSENGMIEATTSPIRTADMLEVAHPLLDASEAAERAGFASLASAWRATAMGFADFLVRAQNPDGSWAASYESDGSVSSADPWATPHCLAFLADVTGETYASATAAATQFLGTHDWGLAPSPSTDVHRLFGALVDRARVTGDAGLLAKARAMATYVESLVYAYEFPTMPSYDMEDPYASTSSTPSPWPACGISGHSRYLGATVTWCAADFYSLYRLTQDSRYLRAARLVHHNAQRSCDWDGKLGWCQRGVGPDSYSYDALPVLGTQGPAIFSSFRLAMQLGGLVRLETQWGDASLDVLAPPSPSNPRLRARNVQVRDASAESIVLSAPSMSASVESLSVLRGGSTGVVADVSSLVVSDGIVEDCDGSALAAQAEGVALTNCRFRANEGFGVRLGAVVGTTTITGCDLTMNALGPWNVVANASTLGIANAPAEATNVARDGLVLTNGHVSFDVPFPGPMIEARSGASRTERYGVGAFRPGTTRLYAAGSSSANAQVALSFALSDGSYDDVLTVGPSVAPQVRVNAACAIAGNVGFFSQMPAEQPVITGSRSTSEALTNLLAGLHSLGLINDVSGA